MVKIFERIMRIFRGKVHSTLDGLEDPEEQLSVFVEELNEQVKNTQRAVASAIADEKRLKLEFDEISHQADEWEKKAILALESGDENLAKEALLKKQELEQKALITKQSWEAQKSATDQLKASLNSARQRVDAAKRKYTLLLARYKSAETKKKLATSLSASYSDDSPMQIMEQLNEKILRIEADTEANLELIGGKADTDLEAKFAQLERKKQGDEALQQLKDKLSRKALLENKDPALMAADDLKARLKDA